MSLTFLHLNKQNFKFSAAHFLIFDSQNAEKLHGHNYKVKVDVGFSQDPLSAELGYLVDFTDLKKIIKVELDKLDECIILPVKNQEMQITDFDSDHLQVNFRKRIYVFPKNEVQLLPLKNTSVELLSSFLAKTLMTLFTSFKIEMIQVWVEETDGQSASTTLYVKDLGLS